MDKPVEDQEVPQQEQEDVPPPPPAEAPQEQEQQQEQEQPQEQEQEQQQEQEQPAEEMNVEHQDATTNLHKVCPLSTNKKANCLTPDCLLDHSL